MCVLEGKSIKQAHARMHTDRNKQADRNKETPFTVAAGNWSLLALSKPPNVSARLGSVGEM